MTDAVLCTVSDAVALLTINRPKTLNAISFEVVDTLMALLDQVECDRSVRAVVLTGAGERAFSAGADIREFASVVEAGPEDALRLFVRRGQRMTARMESFPKPIIAAVNGLAYGGGCEVVEAVALAVASENATFAKPEIKLGFPPPFGGTQRLPRLVGRKRALEMLLVADPVSARQALAMGLVNRVVPQDRLIEEASALARAIVDKSPLAVAATLASVTRGLNVSIDEGLAIEAGHFASMVPTADIQEGINAFLEKRHPEFRGA